MKDVDKFISPLHNCHNPKGKVEEYLKDSGFKNYIVDLKDKSFIYEGIEVFKGKVMNVK